MSKRIIIIKFMGFIMLSRLSLDTYKIPSVENPPRSSFLTFLTYYYFLHARLINPPPRFYENIVIYTRRRDAGVSRSAEFCRPPVSRAARNTGAESFYLTFDSGREGEKKEACVHSRARQKGKEKGVRGRGGGEGGKKREKEKGKTSTNRRRWRLRERVPPSVLSRRGAATPGVVSSAACAVTLARYSWSSRACTWQCA